MKVGDSHERVFTHTNERFPIVIEHAKLGTFIATIPDSRFKVATVTGQTSDEAFHRMVALILAQI